MTNKPVKRSRLNYGLDNTTPAYILDTEDNQYLCRGLVTPNSFSKGMHMEIHDVEVLDTLTEEELEQYSEKQIAEYNGEEWIKAGLKLDTSVREDPDIEARIMEYNGPSDRVSTMIEDEDVERYVEGAMEALPEEFKR